MDYDCQQPERLYNPRNPLIRRIPVQTAGRVGKFLCNLQMPIIRSHSSKDYGLASFRTAVCLLLTLLNGGMCSAQQTTSREIAAARVNAPPVIDGKLDDASWKALPSSSGFSDGTLGTLVKDDTTVWIGYDDKNIYVAVYCRDSDPKGIVARETKRGTGFRGEDRIRLRLNPFNSKRFEDESEISVNALGTQSAEFAGGRAVKQEWEGVWQSAAQIVADGWTAEMAIPWRNFVRPAATGKPTTLGLNFERYQARTQISSYWSNLGIQERLELGGQWVGVVLPPAEAVNPLSVLGYTFGGYDRRAARGRGGFDARYQFTPSLTGLATWNPDFSNVEQAVTSIDFSYSEILPEETRPFFLEGGDYYEGGGGGGGRPFASVRVPQFDLGSKFYGRIGQTNLGVLSAQGFAGRNDSVVSVRHLFSPFASAGFQAVSRVESGINNQVFMGSGSVRRGDWNLSLRSGKSFDRSGTGETHSANLFWQSKAWFMGASAVSISRNLQMRDGFIPFLDQKGLTFFGGYGGEWRSGPIREFQAFIDVSRFNHQNGDFFRDGVEGEIEMRLANDLALSLSGLAGRFEQNRDRLYGVGLRYPALNKFQFFGIDYSWGRLDGSRYSSLGPFITWRFFNRLSVGLSSEIVQHDESEQQHILTVAYDLSRDQAIGGRLVRRNSRTNGYLSLRRSGYGGTEYFIILGDPNAETFSKRLVFKIVRPF